MFPDGIARTTRYLRRRRPGRTTLPKDADRVAVDVCAVWVGGYLVLPARQRKGCSRICPAFRSPKCLAARRSSPNPARNSSLPPSPMLSTYFRVPMNSMSDGPRVSAPFVIDGSSVSTSTSDPLIVDQGDRAVERKAEVGLESLMERAGISRYSTPPRLDDIEVSGGVGQVPRAVQPTRHHLPRRVRGRGRADRDHHRQGNDGRCGDGGGSTESVHGSPLARCARRFLTPTFETMSNEYPITPESPGPVESTIRPNTTVSNRRSADSCHSLESRRSPRWYQSAPAATDAVIAGSACRSNCVR